MTEREILTIIKEHGSIGYTELLNIAVEKNEGELNNDTKRIQHLKNNNFISGYLKPNENIKITASGLAHLDSLEHEENLRKEQYAHNWKVAVFSAIAGALLSEPLWSCIDWFIAAFQKVIK